MSLSKHAVKLKEDFSNLDEFWKGIAQMVGEDYVSGHEHEKEVQDRLALEVTGSVNALKTEIGTNILEQGLADFFRGDNTWFNLTDTYSVDKEGKETPMSSKAGLSDGNNLYRNTATLVSNNYMNIPFPSASGRFGTYYENILFRGGAGSQSDPDTEEGEVKTSLMNPNATMFLKKTLQRRVSSRQKSRALTIGKVNTFKAYLNKAIKDGVSDEVLQERIRAMVLHKFTWKMENLLVAGVEKKEDSREYTYDAEANKILTVKGRFFFTFLYFHYKLLIKKVIDFIDTNIIISRTIISEQNPGEYKNYGKTLKIKRGDDDPSGNVTLRRMEILMAASFLPELGKAIGDDGNIFLTIAKKEGAFYAATAVLYDDTQARFQSSKAFFETITAGKLK